MKKLISILLIVFSICCALELSAQNQEQQYTINKGQILYGEVVVKKADINSFVILKYGYAKDKYHVFYKGKILPYVDPSTFQLIIPPDKYTIRNGKVFFNDIEIKVTSVSNFKDLGDGYGTDSFNSYYRGNKIPNASSHSFNYLGNGYAKDSWKVYYNGEKMRDATAMSFKILGDGYAKDAWKVFYNGVQIKGADASSFQCLGDGYAKDTWHSYYLGTKQK